jgi:hypothetical protein
VVNFGFARINDRGAHSLRHTAAAEMVNSGASFKDGADVLGHKSITTTFIYELDMKSLMRVARPGPEVHDEHHEVVGIPETKFSSGAAWNTVSGISVLCHP